MSPASSLLLGNASRDPGCVGSGLAGLLSMVLAGHGLLRAAGACHTRGRGRPPLRPDAASSGPTTRVEGCVMEAELRGGPPGHTSTRSFSKELQGSPVGSVVDFYQFDHSCGKIERKISSLNPTCGPFGRHMLRSESRRLFAGGLPAGCRPRPRVRQRARERARVTSTCRALCLQACNVGAAATPLYRRRRRGAEKWPDLPKVTQLTWRHWGSKACHLAAEPVLPATALSCRLVSCASADDLRDSHGGQNYVPLQGAYDAAPRPRGCVEVHGKGQLHVQGELRPLVGAP